MADTWTGLNSFMLTHLWWHLALFYLSQGRRARVLEIYDRHCWGVAKDYSQDQIGAVSLLARMELAGIDVGDRWQDLGEHLAARAHDTVLPFLTMQYLYGLARAGRAEADALLNSVRRAADGAARVPREVWQEVALPACEGLYAYARANFERAWRHLSAARRRASSRRAAAMRSAICSNRFCSMRQSAAAGSAWRSKCWNCGADRSRWRAGQLGARPRVRRTRAAGAGRTSARARSGDRVSRHP